jgi:hypothetical protein
MNKLRVGRAEAVALRYQPGRVDLPSLYSKSGSERRHSVRMARACRSDVDTGLSVTSLQLVEVCPYVSAAFGCACFPRCF